MPAVGIGLTSFISILTCLSFSPFKDHPEALEIVCLTPLIRTKQVTAPATTHFELSGQRLSDKTFRSCSLQFRMVALPFTANVAVSEYDIEAIPFCERITTRIITTKFNLKLDGSKKNIVKEFELLRFF